MSNWYVSQSGSPPAPHGTGTGSLTAPWDINSLFGAVSDETLGPQATIVSKAIQPGDVVFMLPGRYASPGPYMWWPTLRGAVGNPIVIRSFPGSARPQLDVMSFEDSFFLDNPLRASNVDGYTVANVDFWDIEWYSSSIVRATTATGNNGIPNGVLVEGQNIRLIHCYLHDLGDFATFQLASNNVIYGCITMDHGWNAPDRGHGHLMYVENDNSNGSIKQIENNFGFTSYDDGVQEYGTAALTRDINFVKNTLANAGGAPAISQALIQWMIGQNNPTGITCDSNMFFVSANLGSGQVFFGWNYDDVNGTGSFTNNYVIGPTFQAYNWSKATITGNKIFPNATDIEFWLYDAGGWDPPATPQSFAGWTVNDNTYGPATKFTTGTRHLDSATLNPTVDSQNNQTVPAGWQSAIGGDANSVFNATPSLAVLVYPSTFIPGRVHITAWNPAGLATVPCNLSGAGLTDGATFNLIDAQNYGNGGGEKGPVVVSGTYSAASPIINLPATGLTRKPMIGIGAIPHTAPYLLTFVLLSGLALTGEWNPIPGSPLPPLGPPPPPPPPVIISGVKMTGSFSASPSTFPTGGGNVVLEWSNLLLASGTAPTSLMLIANPAVSAFPAAGTSVPDVHTTPGFAVTQTTQFTLLDTSGDSLQLTVTVGGTTVTPPPTVTQTWTVGGGALPAGITLTAEGLLSGTFTATGPYSFTVNMVDSNSNTGTITYSGAIGAAIVVTPPTGDPKTISPSVLPAFTVGQTISIQLTAA